MHFLSNPYTRIALLMDEWVGIVYKALWFLLSAYMHFLSNPYTRVA